MTAARRIAEAFAQVRKDRETERTNRITETGRGGLQYATPGTVELIQNAYDVSRLRRAIASKR